MRYIFRGHTIFTYDAWRCKVVQNKIHGVIPAFDYCNFIEEDYKLLGEFFHKAYLHTIGDNVVLEDTIVN